jgi:RNA polymerase sigma-70 factor, ECF subfamily
MDDATLTAALAADLDGAFEHLVLAHQDRLYSIALRVLGDREDAEEVAQDAFVRAYRAIAGYPGQRTRDLQLRPWLAAIVVNLCRNRVRRHRLPTTPLEPRDDEAPLPQIPAHDPLERPHDAALRRESAADWASLLDALPDRFRIPIVLRHVDGLSYEEMSTALGRPEGTLKAQVHRGLAQLRAAAEQAAVLDREVMTA